MGYIIHPRTQQERRENADPDVADFVRAKRKPRNLPTYYEDFPHARGCNSKPRRKSYRR